MIIWKVTPERDAGNICKDQECKCLTLLIPQTYPERDNDKSY